MLSNIHEERRSIQDASPAQLERLAEFIFEHFPEEAESGDLDSEKGTVDLAIELLERLWRWEH